MARPARNPLLSVKKVSQLRGLYLIAGDEPFLIMDALDQLRHLTAHHGDWERHEVTGKTLPAEFDEWLSPSMFAEERVVHLILPHGLFREALDRLKQAFDNPVSGRIVVVQIGNFDRRERNTLKLAWVNKTLLPAGCVVDATRLYESPPPWKTHPQPWDSELAQWTRDRAHRLWGLTLPPRELMTLINRCGNEPGRLTGELEKLSLLLHPHREVTLPAIDALVPDSREAVLEAFSNALRRLDAPELLRRLHGAESHGLESRGRRLIRPEEQAPVILKVLQNAVENLLLVQRFRRRHPDPGPETLKQLDTDLGLNRIPLPSLRDRVREDWLADSRRVRPETLLNWQKQIHQTRRRTRLGGPVRHLLWDLVTQLLEKRLVTRG